MTRLRVLLVMLLVPAVIVATPGVGNAANYNNWHRLRIQLDGAMVNPTPTTCEFPARYSADGSGVSVGSGKCFSSALDAPGQQVPEPGSSFKVEFNGERAGEAGTDGWQWSGMTYTAGYPFTAPQTSRAYALDADPSINPSFYGGSTSGTIYIRRHPDSDPTKSFRPAADVKCAYPDGTGSEVVLSAAGGSLIAAGQVLAYQPWACKTAGKSLSYVMVWNSAISSGDPNQVGQHQNFIQSGAVIAPGAGAGDPCSATYSGTLTDHPDNGFVGLAGTLPAGDAVFAAGVGGKCHVTEVCVTIEADSWAGTATHSRCSVSEWGAPWEKEAPDETDVDELAPVPDASTPVETPVDEPSFWNAILTALKSLATAVGNIAGAILDGLTGLFVPSDGFMEAQGSALKDAWASTPPLVVLDGVQDLGNSLVIAQPPGACSGPSLDFATEMTGAVSLSPLSTCRSEVATLASIIKTALTVVVYVGAFLAGVRIIGSAFGVDLSMSKGGDTV